MQDNKKQILIGIFTGVLLSFLTLLILTTSLPQIKAQQTQQKYTVFKTQNEGFKFLKKIAGRTNQFELAPLFAQTPSENSPPEQVATKGYVDRKVSVISGGGISLDSIKVVESQGRGNRGLVFCPNIFKQIAISATYQGWDVGAKEDEWYGVTPLYQKDIEEDTDRVEIFLSSKVPIGANFINTDGYWMTCLDIGEVPMRIIKIVSDKLEDMNEAGNYNPNFAHYIPRYDDR